MAAVGAAGAAARASRLAGHQGSSLPGKVAAAVSPSILADLAGQVRKKVFVVCGTNGKTSVNNILCHMLEAEGNRVVCNRLGANMPAGITGAFTEAARLSGTLDADYACLEVDEASACHVLGALQPDYLILTNLFRDQLDRYGEIDTTMELLKKAIALVPEMKLLVNADDPLSVSLAAECGNPAVFYGIAPHMPRGQARLHMTAPAGRDHEDFPEEDRQDPRGDPASGRTAEVREGRFCRRCGTPLSYALIHYGQMGLWHCPGCGSHRPDPQYEAEDVILSGGVSFSVYEYAAGTGGFFPASPGIRGENIDGDRSEKTEGAGPARRPEKSEDGRLTGRAGADEDIDGRERQQAEPSGTVSSGLRGLYSVYNLLAVWTALREDGQSCSRFFNDVMKQYRPPFGRNEVFRINGTEIILSLAKNPAGFNQNIAAMLEDRGPKRVVIAINDNDQDGTDVSWLWDVDFERVRDETIRSVTVSGIRALDMRLRLRYEEIDAGLQESPEAAIGEMLKTGRERIYALVNYTALFPAHSYLQKMEKERSALGSETCGKRK